MANFEDFLSNFPYPASYLAFAHKDCSEGASANKKKLSPMRKHMENDPTRPPIPPPTYGKFHMFFADNF